MTMPSWRNQIRHVTCILLNILVLTESNCEFPEEIRGEWIGEQTTLVIGQGSYNESGFHSNGDKQIVIADCEERRDDLFLLSTPYEIDGFIYYGYLCWSYFKVNDNLLHIYANMTSYPPAPLGTVLTCPPALNISPEPPQNGAIGTFRKATIEATICPFIGTYQWNFQCASGNSSLDICKFPFNTFEVGNQCQQEDFLDTEESDIYKCVASWKGLHEVQYLTFIREHFSPSGAKTTKFYCYGYIQYSNNLMKGIIREDGCQSLSREIINKNSGNVVSLCEVYRHGDCSVAIGSSASCVSLHFVITTIASCGIIWEFIKGILPRHVT